jgi:type IV secretion system protein VirB6
LRCGFKRCATGSAPSTSTSLRMLAARALLRAVRSAWRSLLRTVRQPIMIIPSLVFPLFLLGAVFGKLMEASGSARVLGDGIIHWLGAGRAILAASNTGITEPTNGLSMIWSTANRAAAAFSEQAGYFSVLPAIISGIIMFFTGLFIAVALAILILAKVMLWVLIGTAPIFIACLLFEPSRSYGMGWISQLILYSLIPLFVFVVAAFLIAAMDPELTQINAKTQSRTLQLSDFAAFILLCLAGSFVLFNIQVLAQGIAGAIATGLGQVAKYATGLGVGTGIRAARGLAGAVGRQGMIARQRTHDGMHQNIRNASAQAMQNRISANSAPR